MIYKPLHDSVKIKQWQNIEFYCKIVVLTKDHIKISVVNIGMC